MYKDVMETNSIPQVGDNINTNDNHLGFKP